MAKLFIIIHQPAHSNDVNVDQKVTIDVEKAILRARELASTCWGMYPPEPVLVERRYAKRDWDSTQFVYSCSNRGDVVHVKALDFDDQRTPTT